MSRWSKFYDKLASARSDNNIDYAEIVSYLERLGWSTASTGTSHRFYTHPLVPAAVNVQPGPSGKAKAYQVAQVRAALTLYTGDDIDAWLRG